jgi:phosphotransferase system enzyme I (PtsI)
VKDISERVISALQGKSSSGDLGEEPVIVVAEDLAPSETVQMDKSKLLAFVTRLGSSNSHTAILARTMNIPALIGVEIDESWNGKMAIVDGRKGLFLVDPDMATLESYMEEKKKEEEARQLLQTLKGQPDETVDGHHIKLYANIGSVADVAAVLANDAAGIGLFRSEFLYLEKDDYPTEEEQFQVYKTVAQNMAGKKVVIRTLDIGADKQVDYFNMDHEDNPAMGYRAIRICLDRVEIFKTQLRALYRASAFGTISIMFPMIISVKEVQDIKAIVEEVKAELTEAGIEYGEVELGIMIETPAAVMISDLLAKEVDFFSIGTNDLTQYTLAIDRQNPKLDNIYDSHHPAILRMIQMVIDNGHKENCWVGICGELGADTTLTEQFVKMGIDELSVSPTFVLPVRKVIRETSFQ